MRALTLATLVGLLAAWPTHGLSTQEREEYAARFNIDPSEVEEHMFTKREVALAKMYMCLPHALTPDELEVFQSGDSGMALSNAFVEKAREDGISPLALVAGYTAQPEEFVVRAVVCLVDELGVSIDSVGPGLSPAGAAEEGCYFEISAFLYSRGADRRAAARHLTESETAKFTKDALVSQQVVFDMCKQHYPKSLKRAKRPGRIKPAAMAAYDELVNQQYAARLTAFYTQYDKSKLSNVDTLLNKYNGTEARGALLAALVKKYGPEPEADDDDAVLRRSEL